MARIIKKPTERRSDIVNAARYLFQSKEYDKTTMQDVMDYLGIAKGTIYHYFESKEAILEAVIEDIVHENFEQMQSIVESPTGTALEKIKSLIKVGNMTASNNFIVDPLHRSCNSSMHTRLLATALMKQASLYAKVIQQGCYEGIFQTNNPLECAEFVLAGVQFLTDMGIYPWSQEDLSRRAQTFPQFIEQLLKAPQGSFQFMLKNTKIVDKRISYKNNEVKNGKC